MVVAISPLVAPTGMGTVMLVLLHDVGVAAMPLKTTVLGPCASPKLVPVRVTAVPMVAVQGVHAVITGITLNDFTLLAAPLAFVTTTSTMPTAKLDGTGTTTDVSLQELGVAATPPKVTAPGEAPKPEPLIVTGLPTGLTGPKDGDRLLMLGADCAWRERKEPKITAHKVR